MDADICNVYVWKTLCNGWCTYSIPAFLSNSNQQQEEQKTNKLDKSKVKEEKDFKFNCEVCEYGFPKESVLEEHNKLHEKVCFMFIGIDTVWCKEPRLELMRFSEG